MRELKNGRIVAADCRPMEGGVWVSTHTDISEQERDRARIYYVSRHDTLTSLPNRLMFQDELRKAISRLAGDGLLAVHCIDLDQFKQVKDALGHMVGDRLLRGVAERIQTILSPGDLVARWGGGEFAIIQTECRNHADAAALAQRVIEVCGQPHHIEGHSVVVGTSVGIALALSDTDRALRTLQSLRGFDIRITLDDFGTGYSSLSFLAKFPFDKIKTDRSFVSSGSDTGLSRAIVRAIAALGVSLGVPTTAEGVETADRLEAVANEGCSQGQGWYFGRPVPAARIRDLLSADAP